MVLGPTFWKYQVLYPRHFSVLPTFTTVRRILSDGRLLFFSIIVKFLLLYNCIFTTELIWNYVAKFHLKKKRRPQSWITLKKINVSELHFCNIYSHSNGGIITGKSIWQHCIKGGRSIDTSIEHNEIRKLKIKLSAVTPWGRNFAKCVRPLSCVWTKLILMVRTTVYVKSY